MSAQLRSRGWAFHPFSSNAGKTKYVYSIYGDVFQRERLESKAREERLSESVDILHSRLQREISRRELLEEKIKMVRGHLCKGFLVLSMELIEGGKEGFRGWGRELREGEGVGGVGSFGMGRPPPPPRIFYTIAQPLNSLFVYRVAWNMASLSYKSSENSGFHSIESR